MQRFTSLLLILAITILVGGCQMPANPTQPTATPAATESTSGSATLTATPVFTTTLSITPTATGAISATVAVTATPAMSATEVVTSIPTATSTPPITGTGTTTSTVPVTPTQSLTSTAATAATQTITSAAAPTATIGLSGTANITSGQLISIPTLPTDMSNMTIAQIISSTTGFEQLTNALTSAGLLGVLDAPGPLTLFAPTDNAFAIYPTATIESLLNDPTLLNQVLQYHVIVDSSPLAQLMELGGALTYMGEQVTISVDAGSTYRVNDAIIIQSDIQAANGVIHVINGLLVPTSAQSLLSARTVNPQAATDTGSRPLTLEELAAADTSNQTVLDIIRSIDGFTTLVAAVDATGLNDALSVGEPVTLFAPTNGAFAELSTGSLETLLNSQPSQLTRILQYHTVLGNVPATQLAQLGTVLTATGDPITVTVNTDGVILLNGGAATVFLADIEASNGVVHAISAVLQPPTATQ